MLGWGYYILSLCYFVFTFTCFSLARCLQGVCSFLFHPLLPFWVLWAISTIFGVYSLGCSSAPSWHLIVLQELRPCCLGWIDVLIFLCIWAIAHCLLCAPTALAVSILPGCLITVALCSLFMLLGLGWNREPWMPAVSDSFPT